MKCSKIQQLLSNYLDGAVSEKDIRVIEEHLKACPKCQKELEALEKIKHALDMTHEVVVSRDFEKIILNQIRKLKITSRVTVPFYQRLPKLVYTGIVAAVLTLTVLCGNYMGRRLHIEYAQRQASKKIEIVSSLYQYGLCFEIPDSTFSVHYISIKM